MTSARRKTPDIRLSKLLSPYLELAPALDRPVTDLGLDSRALRPGALFCALRGTRGHGLDFADQAVQRGAAAILAQPGGRWDEAAIAKLRDGLNVPVIVLPELDKRLSELAGRFYGDPGAGLDLIAVTGTNGKTSVSQFIAQALGAVRPCAAVGTLGYGFPADLSPTHHTTPDAVRLQAILVELRGRGAKAVALEVSSHALDQGRAAALPVDTAVFTNLTRDHLDYHGDMEGYARAKQRLFHLPGLRHAVINLDDPFGRTIRGDLAPTVVPVVYGFSQEVENGAAHWLRAAGLQTLTRGSRVEVSSSWGDGEFTTSLLGGFNVSNLLAVLAVLLLRDWRLEHALAQLEQLHGVPGRMECFGDEGQPLVVVDYAHTPDALEQALRVLRQHRPRSLNCLFGCGGDRDIGKRPQMGAVAERLADRVMITDDNPRSEDGDRIVGHILEGMEQPGRAAVERNRAKAIRRLIGEADAGDIVLVAGKGHETTQTIGDRVLPFSDREQVLQALRAAGGEAR